MEALQAGNCAGFGNEMAKGYTNTITAGGYNTNILNTFEATQRTALMALYQLPDAIRAILARIRQGNIDKKESVSISDIIHNYQSAFGVGKIKNGVIEYHQPLVLSDGTTTISEIQLIFSDNLLKTNTFPLPAAIDISLKDRHEKETSISYGYESKTSTNWIIITDNKIDEFDALKQYLKPPSYTATFMVSGKQLREIYCDDINKCKSPSIEKCEDIANLINKYSDEFGITDALKMSHFIGQIGAESNGGQLENSYSAAGMLINNLTRTAQKNSNGEYVLKYCDLFEGYDKTSDGCPFPNCDKSIIIPSSEIEIIEKVAYASKDYMKNRSGLSAKSKYTDNNPNNTDFFDYVYACRKFLQNCNISSHDGSRFRGRGALQLTGYSNYKIFQDNFKTTFGNNSKDFICGSPCNKTYSQDNKTICDKNLDYITTLEGGMQAALIYWKKNSVNADATEVSDAIIRTVTKDVNGNLNGIATRKKYTKKAYKILNK